MNIITLDMLLEFLYNQFIGAFVWCFLGSIAREVFDSRKADSNNKKKKKVRNIDVASMFIASIFSTILAIACTGYIKELRVEIYLLICIVLGIWGKTIMGCIMDRKFLYNFCTNVAKTIANPIIKSVAESASKTLEDKDKQQSKKSDNKETKNEEK